MLRYKILSVAIILGCIVFCSAIIISGLEKAQALNSYNTLLKAQGNSTNSTNALYPKIVPSSYTGDVDKCILVIPKMGITGKLRSDTVDDYNAVYHYPESANPGQSGECGLLSHRTHYSGLFSKLGTLEVGDEVIIKDMSVNKKYTYKVTSNGNDIRWDYETNPITFAHSGDARLLLVTCYPPGKKEAAFITHCKLESTTSLT
ncbi:MAG: class E sortase [Methanobacterium sp.]